MKAKNIEVTVGHREDMAKNFIEAWHQAEAGHIFNKTLGMKILKAVIRY